MNITSIIATVVFLYMCYVVGFIIGLVVESYRIEKRKIKKNY